MNANSKVIRLKECIDSPAARPVWIGCCLLLCVAAVLFGYRPLGNKLKDASSRLQEVQNELLEHHTVIAALAKVDVAEKIIPHHKIPPAIDALTEKGRAFEIRFISISPDKLVETTQPHIWRLPVSFIIESGYKNLGQFMDYIEQSFRALVVTESIAMNPKEENNSVLRTALVLNFYVERNNEAKH